MDTHPEYVRTHPETRIEDVQYNSRSQDRLVDLLYNNYNVVRNDEDGNCTDALTDFNRHLYWERMRFISGSTTEFGFTYDYYDELYEITERLEAWDDSTDYDDEYWNLQAEELAVCAKDFLMKEYDYILPFDDVFNQEKNCYMYVLGRARGRLENVEHENFYEDFLENYDDTMITFDQVTEFKRKLLLRRVYERVKNPTPDDYLTTDLWDDLYDDNYPDDSANADYCADEMLLYINEADSTLYPPPPAPPAPPVIVGKSEKKDESIIPFDLPVNKPLVGQRSPLVGQKTAADKLTSDDIDNQLFKLAACPTKREKCGPRVVDLQSHRSQPVELKITDFTGLDSCTW